MTWIQAACWSHKNDKLNIAPNVVGGIFSEWTEKGKDRYSLIYDPNRKPIKIPEGSKAYKQLDHWNFHHSEDCYRNVQITDFWFWVDDLLNQVEEPRFYFGKGSPSFITDKVKKTVPVEVYLEIADFGVF